MAVVEEVAMDTGEVAEDADDAEADELEEEVGDDEGDAALKESDPIGKDGDEENDDVWKGLGWKPAAELPREDSPMEKGQPKWDAPNFGPNWDEPSSPSGTASRQTKQVASASRTGSKRPSSNGSTRSGSADRPGKPPLASSQKGGAGADRKSQVGASAVPLIGTLLPEEAVGVGDADADEPLAPVSVCVRIRPLLPWEKQRGEQVGALQVQDGKAGQIVLTPTEDAERARGGGAPRNFRFDAIFGQERSQKDVWDLTQMRKLVNKVVDGFHATVFAYGQTGSGKTHTMEGFVYDHHTGEHGPTVVAVKPRVRVKDTPPEQLGIVPRAVTGLFSQIAKEKLQAPSEEFVVKVSFLQIYNERIFDLLNPAKDLGIGEEDRGLRLRWEENKQQFYVENLFEYECATADDVLKHYCNGVRNKQMASTAMNVASSRSHAVLVLSVARRTPVGSETGADSEATPIYKEVVSKLSLVDLAGSERASASSGEGESNARAARFQEAVNINQSLFVLRKVIVALSRQPEGGDNSHVPYRESKLTSMLRHSIGGNSYMIMLACLSPADKHFEENLSTLQYAARAACIKNEPMMNLDPKDALIQKLQHQLEAAHDWIRQHTGSETLPEELLKLGEEKPRHRGSKTSFNPAQRRSMSNPVKKKSLGSSMEITKGSLSSSTQLKAFENSTSTPPLQRRNSESRISETDEDSGHAGALPPLDPTWSPRGCDPDQLGQLPGRFGRSPANKKRRPPSLPPPGNRPMLPVPGPLLSQSSQGSLPSVPSGGTKKALDPEKVERYGVYLEHKKKPGRFKDGKEKKKLETTAPIWPTSEPNDDRQSTCAAGANTGRARSRSASRTGTPSTMTPPSSNEADSATSGVIADLEEHLREATEANAILESRCENLCNFKDELEQRNGRLQALMEELESDAAAHRSAECAVRAGLWEAMDELKRSKAEVENRVRTLEETVRSVREEAAEYEKENDRVFDANEKLAEEFRQLEAAIKSGASPIIKKASLVASGGSVNEPPKPATDTSAEREAELEKLRAENAELRQAREKLEVFEKALELDSGDGSSHPKEEASGGVASSGNELAGKVALLHSNLVLEASALRKEITGLKKKKWVIQSVLNNGGEREEKAIQREIQEIRQTKKSSVACSTPRSVEVS